MRVNSGVKYDLYDVAITLTGYTCTMPPMTTGIQELDSSAMGVPTGIKTTRYTCM
jgi:hypothetical protein